MWLAVIGDKEKTNADLSLKHLGVLVLSMKFNLYFGVDMGFFRFMSSRYVEDVLGGKLRFTSLSYYRLMEVVYDDCWIGDIQEGVTHAHIEELSIEPGVDSNGMRALLKDQKILDVGEDANVTVKGARVSIEHNGYVLCFAAGELSELKESMWEGDYDACVSFVSIEYLARSLYLHGVTGEGVQVSDVFHPPVIGYVTYADMSVDLTTVSAPVSGSPFLKRTKYSGQQEYRIFFEPKKKVNRDNISICAEFPEGLICKVFSETKPPRKKEMVALKEFDDPLDVLRIVHCKMMRSHTRNFEGSWEEDFEGYLRLFDIREAEEVNDFRNLYFRDALLAYWQLRKSVPFERLDQIFCREYFSRSVITNFLSALEEYMLLVGNAAGKDR